MKHLRRAPAPLSACWLPGNPARQDFQGRISHRLGPVENCQFSTGPTEKGPPSVYSCLDVSTADSVHTFLNKVIY